MDFGLKSVKKQMASLQNQGKWNEALEISYSYWISHKQNRDACILFVSECYWLLKERDYYKYNPDQKYYGMDCICWDFEDKMIQVLKHGMKCFESDPVFQWRIGKLLSTDFLPFLQLADKEQDIPTVMNLGDQMLQKAHDLDPTSILYELDADILPDGIEGRDKNIRDEIQSMDLQRNYSDEILRRSLEYMLQIN